MSDPTKLVRVVVSRTWTHSKNVAYWLTVEAWPAWLGAAGILAALALGWVAAWAAHKDGAAAARFASIALELAGLVTVAIGLRETRELFGRKTGLQEWREKTPKWPGSIVVQLGAGSISLTGGRVHMDVTVNPNPGAPIEERVAALETHVQRINQEAANLRRALDQNADAQREALKTENTSRGKGDDDLRKLIDKAAAGGLRIEAIGLVWLAAGLIVGGLSTELAPYVSGLCG